ncbi:MAG: HAMP domain-containing histidine kinase [Gemmatimonadaceae bacterium]|nr:HAMP domain-containing histidine kinase [Gemmatimonadaceae bacterium]
MTAASGSAEPDPPRARGRGTPSSSGVLRLPVQGPIALQAADFDAVIEVAMNSVADRWEETVGDGLLRDKLTPALAMLATAVRREAASDGIPSPIPVLVPARRMLDLFRQSFLEHLSASDGTPEPVQLLRILAGIERVQDRIDRDAAHRFASRLAGPDGLELVVEVAHDLRSPLTSILFLAETLHQARSGPINNVQERQLGLIYSAAFGLTSLANDVIELARGGDRLVDQQPLAFSITEVMEAVHDIVRPIAEEKGLKLRWSSNGSDSRSGQPGALSRVLLNLATNALKYTDDGHVEISAKQVTRTRMEFAVSDTGRGLPAEALPSLFESFTHRYKPGEYTFSSSGLGLTICRRLVSAMGGELEVASSAETGTRFHFVLELPDATGR